MNNALASPDVNYKDRYVAFLDILGFSDMTEKADEHPDWRIYLRSIVEQLQNMLPQQVEHTGFRFVQFSDCIVMSANRDPDGLWAVISGTNMLVLNMLQRGILLRGGIAAGRFFHDDRIMFGPALVRAHGFDKPGAPPHIALHPSITGDLENISYNAGFKGFVASDPWDLSPILHTLYDIEAYDAVPAPGKIVWDGSAASIANTITRFASDMSSLAAVRAKWRWMQDYWNRSVATRGLLARSHLLPPPFSPTT